MDMGFMTFVWPHHHWPGIALLVDILPHVESDEDLLHITGHGGVIEVQRHPDTELCVRCKLSFLLCLCSRLQGWTGIKLERYPGPAQNMYTQCSSGVELFTENGANTKWCSLVELLEVLVFVDLKFNTCPGYTPKTITLDKQEACAILC